MVKKRGVTLLEVMVAILVLTIGMGVALQTFFSIFGAQRKSQKRLVAIELGRALLERSLYDADNYVFNKDTSAQRWRLYLPQIDGTLNEYTPVVTYSTNYIPMPSNFPQIGDNYADYSYRLDVRKVSDPNLLYIDEVSKRITFYVTVPPVNPALSGWGRGYGSDDSLCEDQAIQDGYIVVMSSIKTRKKLATRIVDQLPASSAMDRVKAGSTQVLVADSSIFSAFLTTDDGLSSGGDLDYNSPYSIFTGSATLNFSGRSDITDQANYNAIIAPVNDMAALPKYDTRKPGIEKWDSSQLDFGTLFNWYTNENPFINEEWVKPNSYWTNKGDRHILGGIPNAAPDRYGSAHLPPADFIPGDKTLWWTKMGDLTFWFDQYGVSIKINEETLWWEKIQVVGTTTQLVNGKTYQLILVKNIRNDSFYPTATGTYDGVRYPYQPGQRIQTYMNIRLVY